MGKNIEEITEDSIEEQESITKKAEEDLIDKTAERLAAIPGLQNDDAVEEKDDDNVEDDDKDGTEDDSSTSQSDDDKDGTEEKDEDDDNVEDDDKDGTEDDSSTSQSDDDKDGKVQIPDAYYRAAIHQEWKPEEIDKFYKSNPELAERTFAKIYESVNKASTEFATIGRLKLQQTQEIEKAKLEKSKTKNIDVNRLREQYEDSDEVINIVEELQKQNDILREEKVSPANHTDQTNDQSIDTFFAADDLKLYNDFYGPGKDEDGKLVPPEKLTPGQKANRHAVLVFADSLITGNAYKGYAMPVSEALELAHLNISAPLQKQKIREEIMGKVVKRSKSITLTGSGKKKVTSSTKSGKPSDDDLITKTEKRLANIFN